MNIEQMYLVLAPDRARFDSLTRGTLPPWTTGAAVPAAGLIVLLADGAPDRVAKTNKISKTNPSL